MKVSKIHLFANLNHHNIIKNQAKNSHLKTKNDIFEKSDINFTSNYKNINAEIIKYSIDWTQFKMCYSGQRKLNLLKGSEYHLKRAAESICMYTDKNIVNFSTIYRPFSGKIDEEKSIKAYSRIMPFVTQQREKLANLYKQKANLDLKAELGKLSVKDNEDFALFCINREIERINKKNIKAGSIYLKPEYYKIMDSEKI